MGQNRLTGIAVFLSMAGLALVGWWWWTYTGLYRLIAELQLQWWGSYDLQLTFVVTAVPVVALPMLVLGVVLGRTEVAARSVPAWSVRQLRDLGIVVLGLGLVGYGGWTWAGASGLDEPAPVELATVLAGKAPAWVTVVDATWVVDAAVSLEANGSERTYHPVVAATANAPYAVFARGPGSGPVTGMLSPGGLPGAVRAVYERDGVITPAHWLVDTRDSPGRRRDAGGFFALAGVILAVGAGVSFLWKR